MVKYRSKAGHAKSSVGGVIAEDCSIAGIIILCVLSAKIPISYQVLYPY